MIICKSIVTICKYFFINYPTFVPMKMYDSQLSTK